MKVNNIAPQVYIDSCAYETVYDEKASSKSFPLHHAVEQGDNETVKQLVSSKPSLLECLNEDGKAPIHIAVAAENKSMILLLLELGAGINLADNYKDTALHLAVQQGDLGFVKFLVENGAKVQLANTVGETPLHLAVKSDKYDIAEFLIQNKASVDECGTWSYFCATGTPLHLAASKNNSSIVNLLLKHGANPNDRNGWGETALHIAAYYKASKDVIKSLVQAGGNVHLNNGINTWTAEGNPLHVAADKNALSALHGLIEAGADINSQNKSKYTPLMVAVKKGSLDCIDALIDLGAKLDLVDKDGYTALDLAKKRMNKPNGKVAFSLLEKAILLNKEAPQA